MKLLRSLATLFVALTAFPAFAQQLVEKPELNAVFSEFSVSGTFAVLDTRTDNLMVVNVARANRRMIPASTFKIANSLVALETGVVADENEIIPYGGKPQPIAAWENDMSIRDAIKVSNVAIYQELARRIGTEGYHDFFRKIAYGNGEIGRDIETFWLKGPLRISAIEQIRFLHHFALRDLPISARSQDIVRDILLLQARNGAMLFGKTGWTTAPEPDIGWFVGWIERNGDVFPFALNMDIASRADADKRQVLALALLARLELF